MTQDTQWLNFVQRIDAIAQNGLTFSESAYDQERYQLLRQIAIEMAAAYTESDPVMMRDLFTRFDGYGYATPKIDARGVVFNSQGILLVREKSDGLWTLPGGWCDVGDAPSEAVVREVHEEAGFETRAVKLLAVLDRQRHDHPAEPVYSYKMFFLCEIISGSATTNHETTGVGFFPLATLPPLSTHRVTVKQIERMFAHRQHPEWPTDFD